MHLKNFSMLRGGDGLYRLSPAYDLLCTRLPIPDDQLALSVAGNKKEVTRRQWLELAEACSIPERAAVRVMSALGGAAELGLDLVSRSFLPQKEKARYVALLRTRGRKLAGFAAR
jgi:serine/threonine-protein kinase HipA